MPAPRGLKPGSKSCLFNAGLEGLLQPVALLPAAVATGLALPEDGFPEMIFSCFIVSAFISGHRARGCVPSLRDSFLSASLSPHLRAGLMNTVAGATGAEPRCTRWRHWCGPSRHSAGSRGPLSPHGAFLAATFCFLLSEQEVCGYE